MSSVPSPTQRKAIDLYLQGYTLNEISEKLNLPKVTSQKLRKYIICAWGKMPSLEDRDEVIVVNDSLDLMRELRKEISDSFPRVWILVYRDDAQKRYGIEVANIWGGKLEDRYLDPIEELIEKFMIEHKVDFVDEWGVKGYGPWRKFQRSQQ